MDYSKASLKRHKELKGKISVVAQDSLNSKDQLSIYYTPGVAAVSEHIVQHPEQMKDYTWVGNTVAVVSDGSSVLGLGNIGPLAAMPVLEGKAMLFREFAGINAVPIVLNVHTADEIVSALKAIAPSFGGINLEDIAAPVCFEVEDRLKAELSIPVFHDDQHGTAIVVLAGLINAVKVAGKEWDGLRIVTSGAGAAGTAVVKLLHKYAPQSEIVMTDSGGVVSRERGDLNHEKLALLSFTNPHNRTGGLADALAGADVFIGVSRPGLVTAEMVRSMNDSSIVFAMANPVPEIMPDEAKQAGAMVVATGRSDFANQVNNALAFPGIFRGALDRRVAQITDEHKVAAAEAMAGLVASPSPDQIIPTIFTVGLTEAVASAVK